MSIRSWFVDRLQGFYEKIIEPALDWVRRAIENVVVALRIFRHNLKEKLARWMQNDAFFLSFIVAAIVAAIYIPKLIVKAQSWVAIIWIESMAIKLKEAVVGILDVSKLIDLITLHKILTVFFDEYKAVFYSFADAVSQLSAELGEGSAYLHAYFASLRGIMHGANAVLGGDPLQVEIEWYTKTSAFFEKANDDFNKYARDPGRLLYDFIDEVLIPAAQESQDVSQAQLDEIRNNRDRLTELTEGEKELRTSLDTFIELQPDVIEDQIRERWDPINEWLIEFEDVFIAELVSKINGIVDALEWQYQQQLKINQAAAKNEADAKRRADIILSMTPEDIGLLGSVWDEVIGVGIDGDYTDWQTAANSIGVNYDEITADYIRDLNVSLALQIEDPTAVRLKPDRDVDIPSPFIGDF